jgi:transcription elongation GreA/GreB family factor
MMRKSKEELLRELLARLRTDLATLERAHRATCEGATHEEAKPENDKDTRALEQSYLARGQATRIEELRASVAAVATLSHDDLGEGRVALGAVVLVEENGKELALLLAPGGGGERIGDGEVQVVTPGSPLGRCLLGASSGQDVQLVTAGRERTLHVVRVQ